MIESMYGQATAVNQERNLGYIFGGVDGSNQLNSRLYTFDMYSEAIELHDELPIKNEKLLKSDILVYCTIQTLCFCKACDINCQRLWADDYSMTARC
jgi:hypothetical protein